MTDERKNEIWAMLTPNHQMALREVFNKPTNDRWVDGYKGALEDLFGSHNLTAQADEKPKEQKYSVGEKVRINCQYPNGEIWDAVMHNRIATIKGCYYKGDVMMYAFEENYRDFGEPWLEPYSDKPSQENPLDVAESVETSADKELIGKETEKFEKFPVDYAQSRLELAKEIVIALINTTDKDNRYGDILAYDAVKIANFIVKRLKETDNENA